MSDIQIGWFVDGAEENSFCLGHKPEPFDSFGEPVLVCKLFKADIENIINDGAQNCLVCDKDVTASKGE